MTRQRWFCCLCGNLTKREPRPDGRALCSAHMTVALDETPADPLVSVPLMTDELTAVRSGGFGRPGGTRGYDRVPLTPEGSARTASDPAYPPSGEDLPPASGTDG